MKGHSVLSIIMIIKDIYSKFIKGSSVLFPFIYSNLRSPQIVETDKVWVLYFGQNVVPRRKLIASDVAVRLGDSNDWERAERNWSVKKRVIIIYKE